MSFILDALKKSESERQKQAGPALFEVRVAAPRGGIPPWAVVAGVALGVATAVIVVLLWRGGAQGTADTATATGSTQTSGPASAGGPATLAGTAAQPNAPATSQSNAPANTPSAASAGTASGVTATQPPVSRYNPPLVDDPAADSGADADELPGDRMPALPAGSTVTPGAYTSSGPAAPAAVNGRSHSTGLPSRDDLLAAGQQIPEVQLNLHVYDAKTATRFVIVNGQRTREGEVLANGVRVDEVTPDGAVMSYRGSRFLLPIQ